MRRLPLSSRLHLNGPGQMQARLAGQSPHKATARQKRGGHPAGPWHQASGPPRRLSQQQLSQTRRHLQLLKHSTSTSHARRVLARCRATTTSHLMWSARHGVPAGQPSLQPKQLKSCPASCSGPWPQPRLWTAQRLHSPPRLWQALDNPLHWQRPVLRMQRQRTHMLKPHTLMQRSRCRRRRRRTARSSPARSMRWRQLSLSAS